MAPKKIGAGKADSSIWAKISNSNIVSQGRRSACDAVYVSKKLLRSTGKAAWFAGTTFLIVVVPLIIEMGRFGIRASYFKFGVFMLVSAILLVSLRSYS